MNDTGLFVTVLYGVLLCSTGEFVFARAGHERPIVVDREGGVSVPPLGLGIPLGVLPDPELDVQTLAVPPDGLLLLYTDGVTDALNVGGTFFDMGRLREAGGDTYSGPPSS